MEIIGSLSAAIATGVVLIVLVGFALVFSRLYTRPSKELTYVRTGLGGEKVIKDTGALVFPILHEVIPINMNTLRLTVDRRQSNSLITQDRLRVDIIAEFFVRVGKTAEEISAAAQTLGKKTLAPDELKDLIEGKFVDALRSVAAGMAMTELHEKRTEFVQKVQDAVKADLEKNGLDLESVSLTGLDQTDRQYFNENNAFDAEGLTKLTEEIETRRKKRNDIEQQTKVAIERERTEADKQTYLIQQDGELAKISQQKTIDEQRARTDAEVATTRAEQLKISEAAEIDRERAVEEARVKKQRDIEIANQDRSIAISNKSREEAAAKAQAEKEQAIAVREEERVVTSRQTEIAERNKAVAILKAQEEAEQQAVEIRVSAEAEKAAAIDRAEAITISARAEAERETLLAEAHKVRQLAEADGLSAKNKAENTLSDEAKNLRLRLAITAELSAIISASVKPLENIDGIKIVDFGGGFQNGGATGGGNSGSGVDRIMDAALNYRVQGPLIDQLVSDLGFEGGLQDLIKKGGSMLSPVGDAATATSQLEAAASAPEAPSAAEAPISNVTPKSKVTVSSNSVKN